MSNRLNTGIMTEKELQRYIRNNYPEENSVCEWKEFKDLKNLFVGHESEDVVSYVSAIANMKGGHLVIGVKDKTLDVVGTVPYNMDSKQAVLRLTQHCTNLSSEGLKVEEFVTSDTNKTVWIIHIPRHLPRCPVIAHRKAWQRIEDSLVEMRPERLNAILEEQMSIDDWSAKIVPDATIEDLDERAIAKAREEFRKCNPRRADEIDGWDVVTFLNKAKLTIKGQVTNAALILLGKEEAEHFLLPAVCKIRWCLKGTDNANKDYRIFSIPMILAVDELQSYIRNTTYRFAIPNSLFPEELPRYDVFTLREPINNAIAHQDYSKGARINVIEYDSERLIFENHAQFIPESVEKVVMDDSPESVYRNPFLVEAMRNVNMVDTEGGGIRKLFLKQKERLFPMPEYDLADGKVKVSIEGKVIDERFARILVNVPEITLRDIILLDKIQKGKALPDEPIAYLRKKKMIEGRKPNIYLAGSVAGSSKDKDLKTAYIKNKSFDDEYFRKLIIVYLKKFKYANRKDFEALLKNKLSDNLKENQKRNKIANLLTYLRKKGLVRSGDGKKWYLVDEDLNEI